MKKPLVCVLLSMVACLSLGASAQAQSICKTPETTWAWDAKVQNSLDSLGLPWKTGVVASDPAACSRCIAGCATARDNCRKNACGIIGAQSDTQNACRNATNNTPQAQQLYIKALNACFAQEKQCDKGCPCT
jgi:hypothetical protein